VDEKNKQLKKGAVKRKRQTEKTKKKDQEKELK